MYKKEDGFYFKIKIIEEPEITSKAGTYSEEKKREILLALKKCKDNQVIEHPRWYVVYMGYVQ